MLSHSTNAVSHGYKRILTIANDTDIIVLGISLFSYTGADKLGFTWNWKQISEHFHSWHLQYDVFRHNKALPAFHAPTGSVNPSFFSGTGKKSAKWSTRPELTITLYHLMVKPETPSSDGIAVIESFVLSLYSISCTLTDVRQARQQIFAQSSRTFEYMYLPPTKAALVE